MLKCLTFKLIFAIIIDKSEHDSGFSFYCPDWLQTKKRLIFTLTSSLALFLSAVTFNNTTMAAAASAAPVKVETAPIVEAQSTAVLQAVPEAMPEVQSQQPIVTVEQYVKTYYAKTPVLAKISQCESQFRQFASDGSVLRGREVRQDVGVMQINETYHKATAQKLGYNIYTLDGNLAYAQYLYDREGSQPWSASKACWGKS